LVLVKYVTNDNGGTRGATEWALTASGPTSISGAGGASSGPDFSAGTYILSESGPSDYSAGTWFCIGGLQTGDQITLAVGQSATCEITNTKRGRIIAEKHTHGGTGSFDFTLSGFAGPLGGGGSSVTHTLSTSPSGTGSTSFDDLVATGVGGQGTYALEEAAQPGWTLMSATCSDGSPPEAI